MLCLVAPIQLLLPAERSANDVAEYVAADSESRMLRSLGKRDCAESAATDALESSPPPRVADSSSSYYSYLLTNVIPARVRMVRAT